MQAKCGDTVKIHFTGKTQNGEVFASSQGDEPLKFVLGGGDILPGLEKAVEGMEKGQRKTIVLSAEEGFGSRQQELILHVKKDQFPEGFDPKVGMELQVPQPDGTFVFFKILDISQEEVKLDANHPLAGQVLTFDVELLEIAEHAPR